MQETFMQTPFVSGYLTALPDLEEHKLGFRIQPANTKDLLKISEALRKAETTEFYKIDKRSS
jgi:hypothetical protein